MMKDSEHHHIKRRAITKRDTLTNRIRKTHLNKMKDEVLYFLAEMAVALAVVDAFIPRAEHYMKTKHSCKKMERCKLHQYSDRLNTDIPDEDKVHMHLHPPHYNPPLHFQRHPQTMTSTDQHVGAVLSYALHLSGQCQEQDLRLDEQGQEEKNTNKNDSSCTLFSHPSIESAAWKSPIIQQFYFLDRPTEKCRCRQCLQSKVVSSQVIT